MDAGAHLIAGERVEETEGGHPKGTPDLIDRACRAAAAAFPDFAATTRADRARLLRRIADAIEARGAAITEAGIAETALPAARLEGERGRTVGQLRLFADHIGDGGYLDRRHDAALPDRKPLPRPDLRTIQRPVGPVAVFGASNFPLAFSVAGGDTASALAAGCPVVVKGHPAHPRTGQIVAEAIAEAVAEGLTGGVFSMVHDGGNTVGAALVEHPAIRAVGFTGSLRGGRALYDLCARRPEPIPFYGELGSINPVFVLPAAAAARGEAIAQGWAASLTMGAGQFCTNPGVAVTLAGADGDAFGRAAAAALSGMDGQTMLTDGIADAFRRGAETVAGGAEALHRGPSEGRNAAPQLYAVGGDEWLGRPDLHHEVFGPLGIHVAARDADQMVAIAEALEGQLTATLQVDDDDYAVAARLLPVLERRAGRILANGFPTGVEVADAMVHSGPWPATTNFGATSVGTLAIRRWLRPVCYQDMPAALLPEDVR